jgi:hypothetical protein
MDMLNTGGVWSMNHMGQRVKRRALLAAGAALTIAAGTLLAGGGCASAEESYGKDFVRLTASYGWPQKSAAAGLLTGRLNGMLNNGGLNGMSPARSYISNRMLTVLQKQKPSQEHSSTELERFDVKKGQVTARVPLTAELREEASRLIQSLGGKADTFRIDPKDGAVLRIPLNPSLEIRKPGFYAYATEVFLFLPVGVSPYMLVFSEENEPRIFGLTQPVDRLLRLCGWEDAREP